MFCVQTFDYDAPISIVDLFSFYVLNDRMNKLSNQLLLLLPEYDKTCDESEIPGKKHKYSIACTFLPTFVVAKCVE